MRLLELKAPKKYVVITGPLSAGKSTLKKSLCATLKVPFVDELQYGVDVSKPEWWKVITDYADENKTSVVEVHFAYDGKDHIDYDAKLGKIPTAPSNIEIHVVLPNPKELQRRQKLIDKYSTLEGAKKELDWYKGVAKQTKAIVHT